MPAAAGAPQVAPAARAPAPGALPAWPSPPPPPPSDYRETQFSATPFPAAYESALWRGARALGIETVSDIYARHRADGGGFSECPPHDMDAAGARAASVDIARAAGAAFDAASLERPALDALRRVTLGLVVVSFDAPETLAATIASWRDAGLLDVADDRVAFLNAASASEIALALAAGFRVYTPAADEVAALLARHRGWLAQFDDVPASKLFPAVRDVGGRPATFVAPSQIMAYLEMATDVVLFAEKDYALPPGTSREATVRALLASAAALQAGTNVVRLRRLDDENRDAIQDCCNTNVCGQSFNDFKGPGCQWSAHLNWLAIFCDARVEARSGGRVRKCFDEGAAPLRAGAAGAPVEPLGAFCFSFDDSGWSNNVAMFRRAWWVAALGHGAVLTEGDNGMFELNMMMICDYLPKKALGSGRDARDRGRICQLTPGLFVHREKEVHESNGAVRVVK